MWIGSIWVRTISGVSFGTMYMTGSAGRITARSVSAVAAVDDARDRRAQVEPGDPCGRATGGASRAVSISRNSRSRSSAIASSRALEISRTRSISISAILPRFSAIEASTCPAVPSQPRQLALRRQHPGHLGQALVEQRLLARRSRGSAGRSATSVAACSAARPSFWLAIWRLLLLELRLLLGLHLRRAANCCCCAAISVGDLGRVGRARDELGIEGDGVEPVALGVQPALARQHLEPLALDDAELGPRSSPSSSTSTSPASTSSPSRAWIALITPPVGCCTTWRLPSTSSAPGAHHRAGDAA